MKKLCMDCGKELPDYRAKRCKPCFAKSVIREKNPNYKQGFNKCLDCGKDLKSYTNKRCQKCNSLFIKGKNNPMWKGDKVGYTSLHEWIKNYLPKPLLCNICKKKPPYDLANISGKYKRDLSDWEWLCRRCHMKKDGRLYFFNKKFDRK